MIGVGYKYIAQGVNFHVGVDRLDAVVIFMMLRLKIELCPEGNG